MALLDRLDAIGNSGVRHRRSAMSIAETLFSVKRNLDVILNSRQGCSLSSPGLGLRDFNDASSGSVDMCVQIAQDIKRSIEAYEPRVSVEEVEYLPSDYNQLQIQFRISCFVKVKDKQEKTEIELLLDNSNRKFRIG